MCTNKTSYAYTQGISYVYTQDIFLVCKFKIYPVYTPPDCTDVVAPCDHHVGAYFKKIMSRFYHQALEDNYDEWCSPVGMGGLTASQRRIHMTIWAAATWVILKEKKNFIRNAFISTGFLINKNRSEDHVIKVSGFPDYDFKI